MNVVGYRRIFHVMPDEFSQNTVLRINVKKIGSAGKLFDIYKNSFMYCQHS